jgi:phosphoenolpyruvate-protein phosphotransferase (PTS system enzyme I)
MTDAPSTFPGIAASAGVAVGRVYLLDRRKVRVPRFHIKSQQETSEKQRLVAAIRSSIEQLQKIQDQSLIEGAEHNAILDAHILMLKDETLLSDACQLIENEHLNAEWAVNKVMGKLRSFLDLAEDEYMKERRNDIDFVGDRIVKNLVGQGCDGNELQALQSGTVVIAHDLSPADTAVLATQKVTGFATQVGSKTSHTSIIARSLDVPAVVACQGLFDQAGHGDTVIIDGIQGHVVLRPSPEQIQNARKRAEAFESLSLEFLRVKSLPANTTDDENIRILGNIELPGESSTVFSRGGEGIGLYRTEFLFVRRETAPDEELHYRTYAGIFDEFSDQIVTFRTMDIGGDKAFKSAPVSPELNPALGLRGIRYAMANPELFENQIAGILRAAVHGPSRILLPMISGIEEIHYAREVIAKVAKRLESEGKEFNADIPLGSMIEVPSAVLIIDSLAKECDFLSVGTNDLMQYLLAIDRINQRVAYLYQPLHPAVIRTLKIIADAAQRHDKPLTLCGEIAGELLCAPVLMGLGFRELSMNAGSIPWVKHLIRELSLADCQVMVKEALLKNSSEEVGNHVLRFIQESIPQEYSLWESAKHVDAESLQPGH